MWARVPLAHQRAPLGRDDERVERRAEGGDVAAQRRLGDRVPLPVAHLDQLRREPGQQLELHPEAHQRLEVRGDVGGRLVELGGHPLHALVDEHVLPRHQHVVEDHGGVHLVEARGERVVVDAGGERGVRPSREQPEPRGAHRHHQRDRVVLVPRDERGDIAHEEPIGHRHRRGDGVGAADHDARVGLPHHPGVEERLRVPVGRRDPVDLGRHDRVGHVEILVARPGVEANDVVPELPAPAVEELPPAREGGEHRGDVIGGAAHQPVRALGPEAVHRAPAPQVLGRARDQPHRADPAAARRIEAGGDLRGLAGGLVALRDAPDGLGEGRMAGDVGDALAVEEDGAPVAQAGEVVDRSAHGGNLAQPHDAAQARCYYARRIACRPGGRP